MLPKEAVVVAIALIAAKSPVISVVNITPGGFARTGATPGRLDPVLGRPDARSPPKVGVRFPRTGWVEFDPTNRAYDATAMSSANASSAARISAERME